MKIKILFIWWITTLSLSSSLWSLKYSTNFMWINKAVVPDNTMIFPEMRMKRDWDINVLDWMAEWLKANPSGEFTLWFDKRTTTPSQITETQKALNELKQKTKATVLLRDIFELPWVKAHPDIFSSETPIYLQVDLLRVVAGIDYLDRCRGECAYVYADVDKGLDERTKSYVDLSEKGLFDAKTLQGLRQISLVMRTGPENSFLIMSNHKPNMIKATKMVVLESNVLRIKRLVAEEKILRAQLPTQTLKAAPFDKNFKNVAGFSSIDSELLGKIRSNALSSINDIFRSMVNGPLTLYFKYLEGEINFEGMFDAQILQAKGFEVAVIDLFSRLDVKDPNSPVYLSESDNEKLIRYYSTDKTLTRDAAVNAGQRLLWDLIPLKNIGGSSSQSYWVGW